MKTLLKITMSENGEISVESSFDSNLATLGFLEIIKSVLIEKSEMVEQSEELEENSIAFPIINTNTQA
jgi:hypothetical protein